MGRKNMEFIEIFIIVTSKVNKPLELFPDFCKFKSYCCLLTQYIYNQNLQMSYRRPQQARSPPRNFKVNFIQEPALENTQKTFITNLVPKIARNATTAQQIQTELSNELCRYLKKSVGVSVLENKQGYPQQGITKQFLGTAVISFTMNEYTYRIWIHQSKELDENPFGERRQQTK